MGHRFVDLSGYAFTGKHAVIDFMREMRDYHVEHFAFEFALLRIQGGIHDLEAALVEHWSPLRSDAGIRRFRRVVRRLGTVNQISRPSSWFEAVGWNYDAHYQGRFLALSDAYLKHLISAEWSADWPFALAELAPLELFARKCLSKLRVPGAMSFPIVLAAPEDFVRHTRDYLQTLLASNVAPQTRTIVLHNAFEPFDPLRSIRLFDDARTIVVDRDPRDNYVQGLWYKPTAVDVHTFVQRYRLYRRKTNYQPDARVLRLAFEDLVLDYDRTRERILAFLGEAADAHVRPKMYFNPEQSKKNVGLWRTYDRPDEIATIAAALPEYCDARI
jgi:hypothetical protein